MVCVRTSWKLLHNGPVVRYTELGAQRAMSGASGMRDASVRFTGLLIEPRWVATRPQLSDEVPRRWFHPLAYLTIWRACQIIIGGGTYSSNCSSLKLDSLHTRRQQQTKKCSMRSSSRNTAYITCYPLQENSLSLVVSYLPTNCLAYLQRLTDLKTLLFVIIWTVYSVNDVF